MRGGKRMGAGRPKGSAMTKTAVLASKLSADGITPLEFILNVMRDEAQPLPMRLNCAMAAAPFIHARLASIQVERKPNNAILKQLLDRIKEDGKMVINQEPMKVISAPARV